MALPEIGEVVQGRYEITELLGTGGFGRVYKAVHLAMDRPVAIKCLHLDLVRDPKLREVTRKRFLQEARIISRLHHPNTVQVFDFGALDDAQEQLFMVVELIEGKPIDEVIEARGALDAQTTAHILRQVLGSLDEAHGAGVVHRDIKPQNIMITERLGDPWFVKVLDFGIAAPMPTPDAATAEGLTMAGAIIGTPGHMSPEQLCGEPVGPASDIYCVGLMAYEMLVGTPAYSHEVTAPALTEQAFGPDLDLPESVQCPDWLRQAVTKALRKDLSERVCDAEAFVAMLQPRQTPAEPPQAATVEVDAQEMARQDKATHQAAFAATAASMDVVEPPGFVVGTAETLASLDSVASSVEVQLPSTAPKRDVERASTLPEPPSSVPTEQTPPEPKPEPEAVADVPDTIPEAPKGGWMVWVGAAVVLAAVVGGVVALMQSGTQGTQSAKEEAAVAAQGEGDGDVPSKEAASDGAQLKLARQALDAFYKGAAEPPMPETCQARQAATLKALQGAVAALAGGRPLSRRPQDKDTVTALGKVASESAELLAWKARAQLYAGDDLRAARQAALGASQSCPSMALARKLEADIRLLEKDRTGAIKAYELAIEISPGFKGAHYNLGLAFLLEKQYQRAVDVLGRLLEMEGEPVEGVHVARARAYAALGEHKLALKDAQMALKLKPDDAQAARIRDAAQKKLEGGDD